MEGGRTRVGTPQREAADVDGLAGAGVLVGKHSAAAAADRDLITSDGCHGRSAGHPETIDPVRVDVALRSITGPLLLTDLAFFRDRDRDLHLVPERGGLSVKLGRHGVEIGTRLPWNCLWDRAAGLECAAAQIVRACRTEHQG
jgi:hypothetical protein